MLEASRGGREGGGTVLNTLKGVEQKRGDGKQRFLKEGASASRGGCLKYGGGWNPLTNYDISRTLKILKEVLSVSPVALIVTYKYL